MIVETSCALNECDVEPETTLNRMIRLDQPDAMTVPRFAKSVISNSGFGTAATRVNLFPASCRLDAVNGLPTGT